MGFFLADAAVKIGAKVTVISGVCTVSDMYNPEINVIKVLTAQEMLLAVEHQIEQHNIFISCAAVCDYKVKDIAKYKIKKPKSIV